MCVCVCLCVCVCVCVCVQDEGAPAEGVIDSPGTGPDVTPLPCVQPVSPVNAQWRG